MSSSDHRGWKAGRKTAATKRDAVVQRVVARRASHHRSCDGAGFGGCGRRMWSAWREAVPTHKLHNTTHLLSQRLGARVTAASIRSCAPTHAPTSHVSIANARGACSAMRAVRFGGDAFCAAGARFALFACRACAAARGACARWSLGGTRHPRALAQTSTPLSDLTSTSAFLTREIKL